MMRSVLTGMLLLMGCSQPAATASTIPSDCAPAGLTDALQALRSAASGDDGAYQLTRRLVLEVGTRPAGSAAEARAIDWAATELAAAGLSDVRREPFPLRRWGELASTLQVEGAVPQSLRVIALGGAPSTPGPISVPVLRVESLQALSDLPAVTVAGHAVFFDGRMQRTRDRSGYQAAVKARRDGPALAAEKGARLFLLRSIGTDDSRQPHAGMTLFPADAPKIPALALSNADADWLAARLAQGGVSVTADSQTRYDTAQSANVLATLPAGGERDGSGSVVLAAHLDSWHVGLGASDDASGVGTVISAARLLLPHAALLRRNLDVILYGAEEPAIVGGHAYVERHRGRLAHIAAVESDLGSGRLWRLQLPDPARVSRADLLLAAALEPLGIALSLSRPAFGGADIQPLAAHGVRLYDIDPDARHYFDIHHTEEDTLAHVSADNLRQHVAALASFALVIGSVDLHCMQDAAPPIAAKPQARP